MTIVALWKDVEICYVRFDIVELLEWKGDGGMKDEFVRALRKYEEKVGSERARAVRKIFEERKQKVMEDNDHVLQWLPVKKQDITLETLLQKTYEELINEMEETTD